MIKKYLVDMMIKPGKSPVLGNPKNYGLEYEDVTFTAKDGTVLSGWLINGGTDKIIIQSHFGVQCSRSGYTPKEKGMIKMWNKDIEFLRQAKHLVEQGYSVLMFDLRNHGNSGAGKIPYVAWGLEEYKDIIAAVDYISDHYDYKNSKIGLLSICMGTSSTAFAYGVENGLQNYKNIKALISVQPLTYNDFVKSMGFPNFLANITNKGIAQTAGFDITRSFFPNVKNITVPTLVIQNENDPWTNIDSVKEYYDLLNVEKEMHWVKLDKKRAAGYDYLGTNPEVLSTFFNKYM